MSATALDYFRGFTTNSTNDTFVARTVTSAEPSGDGIHDLFNGIYGIAQKPYGPKFIHFVPFGVGADNTTFDMRIWGWSKVNAQSIYVPTLLLDVSLTLCATTATVIAASHRLCDTLSVNDGDDDVADISPVEDLVASATLHTRGNRWIEFDVDLTGGTPATSGNCYWRALDQT